MSSLGTVAATKQTLAQCARVSMSCGSCMCRTITGIPFAVSKRSERSALHTWTKQTMADGGWGWRKGLSEGLKNKKKVGVSTRFASECERGVSP